jgi:rhamnose transport system ATP-binding protein
VTVLKDGRHVTTEATAQLTPGRPDPLATRRQLWQLLADLAGRGVAIVMVSSELPEILALSGRILVMREGRVTAELTRDEASEE